MNMAPEKVLCSYQYMESFVNLLRIRNLQGKSNPLSIYIHNSTEHSSKEPIYYLDVKNPPLKGKCSEKVEETAPNIHEEEESEK